MEAAVGDELLAFRTALAVELARLGLTQRSLARRMGLADTTLSDWLRGVHPVPPRFVQAVETELGVATGTLPRALRERQYRPVIAASRATPDGTNRRLMDVEPTKTLENDSREAKKV
jgi:transcriptional regulator with XRE-family HTH domain